LDAWDVDLELACVVAAAGVDPDEHVTAGVAVDGHLTACGFLCADHERAAHGCDLHAAGVGRGQRFEVVGQVDAGAAVVADGDPVVVLDHGLVGLGGDMHERPVRFGGVVDDERLRSAAGEVAGGVHVRGNIEPVRGVYADVVTGDVDAVRVVRGAQRESVVGYRIEPRPDGVDIHGPAAGAVRGSETDEVAGHIGAAILGGDRDAATLCSNEGVCAAVHLSLSARLYARHSRIAGRGPLEEDVRFGRLVLTGWNQYHRGPPGGLIQVCAQVTGQVGHTVAVDEQRSEDRERALASESRAARHVQVAADGGVGRYVQVAADAGVSGEVGFAGHIEVPAVLDAHRPAGVDAQPALADRGVLQAAGIA